MNLTTTYLGLNLAHPIVAGASPLTRDIDGFLQLEEAGAAAIVMHSLFEEQLIHESRQLHHHLDYGSESYAESLSYTPDLNDYNSGPEGYLELLSKACERVNIPVIGSLNGVTPEGWSDYAQQIEQAGADAIELNLYFFPTDIAISAEDIEAQYATVVKEVSQQIKIPLAVKLCPFFSSIPSMANQLVTAGANGLVLFNRFYQPDLDIENLEVAPHLVLSSPNEFRLPLTWTGILYGQIDADFAITTGVHTHKEVLKAMMAGASIVMMTSSLLKHGVEIIGPVRELTHQWAEEHEYESIQQMRGSLSQKHSPDPTAYIRANYMKTLQSWRPDPALGPSE